MNYYQYHGAHIYDNNNVATLNNAIWEGFTVKRHEMFSDGLVETTIVPSSWMFLSEGRLYRFLTCHPAFISGKIIAPIRSFFELNTRRKDTSNIVFEVVKP